MVNADHKSMDKTSSLLQTCDSVFGSTTRYSPGRTSSPSTSGPLVLDMQVFHNTILGSIDARIYAVCVQKGQELLWQGHLICGCVPSKGEVERQMHVSVAFESRSADAFSFTAESIAEGIKEVNARFSDLIKARESREIETNEDAYTEDSGLMPRIRMTNVMLIEDNKYRALVHQ